MPDPAIVKVFVYESNNRINVLEESISCLETGSRLDDVQPAMVSAVHATKGDAFLLDLNTLGEVASAAEKYFKTIDNTQNIQEVIRVSRNVSGALKSMILEIEKGNYKESENCVELLNSLSLEKV